MLVQADIATALHMRQPLLIRSSSERRNLHKHNSTKISCIELQLKHRGRLASALCWVYLQAH
jgi:hypothetical protein